MYIAYVAYVDQQFAKTSFQEYTSGKKNEKKKKTKKYSSEKVTVDSPM